MNSLVFSCGCEILYVQFTGATGGQIADALNASHFPNDQFNVILPQTSANLSPDIFLSEIAGRFPPRTEYRWSFIFSLPLPKPQCLLFHFSNPLSDDDYSFIHHFQLAAASHHRSVRPPLVVVAPIPYKPDEKEAISKQQKERELSSKTGAFFFTIGSPGQGSFTTANLRDLIRLLKSGAELEKEVVDVRFEGRSLQYVFAILLAPAIVAIIGKFFEKSVDLLHKNVEGLSLIFSSLAIFSIGFFSGWMLCFFKRVDQPAMVEHPSDYRRVFAYSVFFAILYFVVLSFLSMLFRALLW